VAIDPSLPVSEGCERTLRGPACLHDGPGDIAAGLPVRLIRFDADGTCTAVAGELPGEPRELELLTPGIAMSQAWVEFPTLFAAGRAALGGQPASARLETAGRTFEALFRPRLDGGAAVLVTDVTEERRSERELAQSQKMDSLGMMAGSVAHDFNNLLTAILGFAGILKLSPALDDEDREHLFLIEQSARRGADIAGRLLSFARGGLARFVLVDLVEVLRETLRMLTPTLHDGLVLRARLPDGPVRVEGDFGQLQQALLNVLSNARDAMPIRGTIDVRLQSLEGRALVTVRDDGPGMPEDVRTRIFEPFFSTKAAGSGTGLGLAITYGVVQGHHGDLHVDSRLGEGTTFTFSFPLLAAPEATRPEADAGEGDLVLVVDDDDIVRRTTAETLANLGYNVVEVRSGALAVELVGARPERFAAVLLDLVMPGMAGRDVFRALHPLRPDLPVIVCTGYAADAHIDDEMKRSIAGLLQKPFSAESLDGALRSVGTRPARAPRTVAAR